MSLNIDLERLGHRIRSKCRDLPKHFEFHRPQIFMENFELIFAISNCGYHNHPRPSYTSVIRPIIVSLLAFPYAMRHIIGI